MGEGITEIIKVFKKKTTRVEEKKTKQNEERH